MITKQTKFIIRMTVDEEGFDADGCGDYIYTDFKYKEFKSKHEALEYLQTNIYNDANNKRENFKSIGEYVDTYGFKFYEIK